VRLTIVVFVDKVLGFEKVFGFIDRSVKLEPAPACGFLDTFRGNTGRCEPGLDRFYAVVTGRKDDQFKDTATTRLSHTWVQRLLLHLWQPNVRHTSPTLAKRPP